MLITAKTVPLDLNVQASGEERVDSLELCAGCLETPMGERAADRICGSSDQTVEPLGVLGDEGEIDARFALRSGEGTRREEFAEISVAGAIADQE